jgi:hypothetical protein
VEGILQGGFVGRREAQVARYQIHLEDLYSADLFCPIYVGSASASVRVGNGCHPHEPKLASRWPRRISQVSATSSGSEPLSTPTPTK